MEERFRNIEITKLRNKRYYNQEKNEWYIEGDSLDIEVDGEIISIIPDREKLISLGFIKEIITEEQLLEEAKIILISKISLYNNSENVNSFTVNGHSIWLNVQKRQQLLAQINAYEFMNKQSMTKWYEGIEFTFTIPQWKQMFAALEVYCGEALNTTEQHKENVKALNTIEELEYYNYTTNYPEKLNF